MANRFELGILDLCPTRVNGTAADALNESLQLAVAGENLGYRRHWFAEHHGATSYACTSPEIMIALLASQTTLLKIGSGGFMIRNSSALKIAEYFQVLESLFPDRIELGVGSALGAIEATGKLLAAPRRPVPASMYSRQLNELVELLTRGFPRNHPEVGWNVLPGQPRPPLTEVWMLGSGENGARLAGQMGFCFAFADFLSGNPKFGAKAVETYRQCFRASGLLEKPRVRVAVEVLCAPTTEEARFLGASRDLDRINGIGTRLKLRGLLAPGDALGVDLNSEDRRFIDHDSQRCIDGDPNIIVREIEKRAELFSTRDFLISTTCFGMKERLRSYELVANAFGL